MGLINLTILLQHFHKFFGKFITVPYWNAYPMTWIKKWKTFQVMGLPHCSRIFFRKNFLVSLNSPKNRTNEFVAVVKRNSFVRFLGEFKDTKRAFEIIWPLFCENSNKSFQQITAVCRLVKYFQLSLTFWQWASAFL